MSFVIADRVQEISYTAGPGNVTLSGKPSGYFSFAEIMLVGDTCYYCIDDSASGQWEVGIATLIDASTLERTSVLNASEDWPVDFSAGIKNVFITCPSAFLNIIRQQFHTELNVLNALLAGGADEPTRAVVGSANSGYTHWPELKYNDSVNNHAIWMIPTNIVNKYQNGDITVTINWIADAIIGDVVWNVKFKAVSPGQKVDSSFEIPHQVVSTVQSISQDLNTSTITFKPAAAEIIYGTIVFAAVQRLATDSADTLIGDARIVSVTIEEQ